MNGKIRCVPPGAWSLLNDNFDGTRAAHPLGSPQRYHCMHRIVSILDGGLVAREQTILTWGEFDTALYGLTRMLVKGVNE